MTLPYTSVIFDATGQEIEPGCIVLHAGKKGFKRLLVKQIIVRRWDAGDTIHNSARIYCHPIDNRTSWWEPSIIRNPNYLIVVRKRDAE